MFATAACGALFLVVRALPLFLTVFGASASDATIKNLQVAQGRFGLTALASLPRISASVDCDEPHIPPDKKVSRANRIPERLASANLRDASYASRYY